MCCDAIFCMGMAWINHPLVCSFVCFLMISVVTLLLGCFLFYFIDVTIFVGIVVT